VVAFVANAIMCLVALWMGVHFEGTSAAIDRAERGQLVAYAAVPGLLLAIVGALRKKSFAVGALLSLLLAVVAFFISRTG